MSGVIENEYCGKMLQALKFVDGAAQDVAKGVVLKKEQSFCGRAVSKMDFEQMTAFHAARGNADVPGILYQISLKRHVETRFWRIAAAIAVLVIVVAVSIFVGLAGLGYPVFIAGAIVAVLAIKAKYVSYRRKEITEVLNNYYLISAVDTNWANFCKNIQQYNKAKNEKGRMKDCSGTLMEWDNLRRVYEEFAFAAREHQSLASCPEHHADRSEGCGSLQELNKTCDEAKAAEARLIKQMASMLPQESV